MRKSDEKKRARSEEKKGEEKKRARSEERKKSEEKKFFGLIKSEEGGRKEKGERNEKGAGCSGEVENSSLVARKLLFIFRVKYSLVRCTQKVPRRIPALPCPSKLSSQRRDRFRPPASVSP